MKEPHERTQTRDENFSKKKIKINPWATKNSKMNGAQTTTRRPRTFLLSIFGCSWQLGLQIGVIIVEQSVRIPHPVEWTATPSSPTEKYAIRANVATRGNGWTGLEYGQFRSFRSNNSSCGRRPANDRFTVVILHLADRFFIHPRKLENENTSEMVAGKNMWDMKKKQRERANWNYSKNKRGE